MMGPFQNLLDLALLRPSARALVRQGNRGLYVSKIDGEPILTEEARVHIKEEHTGLYIIYFYIAVRDTVVTCEVTPELWHTLAKGQRG